MNASQVDSARAELGGAVASPRARRDWTPTVLLAPVVIYMTVVGFYPLIHSLYISFTDYNPVQGQDGAWVGLANYTTALADQQFWHSLALTGLFTFLSELHVAMAGLPFVVLLQQHRPDQPGDRGLAREDADDVGPALHFFVQPFQRVRAVQLGPVLDRERHVGEHLVLALVHQPGEPRPAGPELVRHLPPDLPGAVLVGL